MISLYLVGITLKRGFARASNHVSFCIKSDIMFLLIVYLNLGCRSTSPTGLMLTCCHIRITKTCLYNFDPLKPHFYIVKLGFAGV